MLFFVKEGCRISSVSFIIIYSIQLCIEENKRQEVLDCSSYYASVVISTESPFLILTSEMIIIHDRKSSLLNLLRNTVQNSPSRPLISHETLYKSEFNYLYGNIPAVKFLIMCIVQSL